MCESLLCENKSLGNLMCAGKSFRCHKQVEDCLVVCHSSLAVRSCKFGCDSNQRYVPGPRVIDEVKVKSTGARGPVEWVSGLRDSRKQPTHQSMKL
jgi:hypothetical protein